MRRCRRCLQEKPDAAFHVAHGWLRRTCKACVRESARDHRKAWRRSEIGRATGRRNDAKQRRKPTRVASMRKYRAAWAEAHPEKVVASRRRYKAGPKGRETEAAYKARLRGAESVGRVTPNDWARLVEAYGGACAYCRIAPVETRDHVTPLSRGGAHTIENLVPACRSCNSKKHTKRIAPWVPLGMRWSDPDLYAGLVRTLYGAAA